MSNSLSTNPLIIDTADTHISGPLSINCIKWVSGGETGKDIAVGDCLVIRVGTDITGKGTRVIDVKATDINDANDATPQEGYSAYFGRPGWMVDSIGLFIDKIDGGELQIFLN